MVKNVIEYILKLSEQPVWIFTGIILASYLLEDLAIISAAVMAADQIIPVPLAVYAILIGIISGDIGLYALGYLLKNNRRFQQWLSRKNRQQHYDSLYDSLFCNNLIKNILLIRFIPGLRFLCYTSCGLFKAHLGQFLIGVSLSGFIWVLGVFTLVYQLGSSAWLEYSDFKWLLIPIALIFLFVSNRQLMRHMQQQKNIA